MGREPGVDSAVGVFRKGGGGAVAARVQASPQGFTFPHPHSLAIGADQKLAETWGKMHRGQTRALQKGQVGRDVGKCFATVVGLENPGDAVCRVVASDPVKSELGSKNQCLGASGRAR